MIGFQFLDYSTSTSKDINDLTTNSNVTSSTSLWYTFIITDTFGVNTLLVIVIGIPLYQIFLRNNIIATRYVLGMLKKIFSGLLCAIMAVLFLQVVEVLIALANPYAKCPYFPNSLLNSNISLDTGIVSYNYLIIPHGLNGLSFILVVLTIIEFILAQAPHDMQGFLIGIWYSLQSINIFILAIESFQTINC